MTARTMLKDMAILVTELIAMEEMLKGNMRNETIKRRRPVSENRERKDDREKVGTEHTFSFSTCSASELEVVVEGECCLRVNPDSSTPVVTSTIIINASTITMSALLINTRRYAGFEEPHENGTNDSRTMHE